MDKQSRNIFFVNTSYQFTVALDVIKHESISDPVFFVSEKVSPFLNEYRIPDFEIIVLFDLNNTKNFLELRKWLKKCLSLLQAFNAEPVVFWLANDDHIFAQVLMSTLTIEECRLFEDGLGSYIPSDTVLLTSKQIRIALSRLKKILFLFPYYKAFNRFGGNVPATRCYSYNKACFPSQINAKKLVIKRNVWNKSSQGLPNNSVVVVGQPLVETSMISSEEYLRLLRTAIDEHFPQQEVIYKAHPSEKLFDKVPSEFTLQLSSTISLDDEIQNTEGQVSIVGFFSTVLLNSLNVSNVKKVFAIRPPKSLVDNRCYDVLDKAGCQIINPNY